MKKEYQTNSSISPTSTSFDSVQQVLTAEVLCEPYEEQLNATFSESYIFINFSNIQPSIRDTQIKTLLKREPCYLKAIQNLLKTKAYLQLLIQLHEGQIKEAKFEQEITENPDKYINQIEFLKSPHEITIISEIMSLIGKEMMLDEVAELFSLDMADIKRNSNLLLTE